MLQYALLGFLSYGSMTGYELKQIIDSSTTHFWHAKQSQIYTTLKSLEGEGMVASAVVEQEERPDRRVYTITPEGRKMLSVWLAQPVTEIEATKTPFLLKLFFSAHLEKDTLLAQLRLQRSLHQAQGDNYRAETRALIREAVESNPAMARDGLLWEATRRFGELYESLFVEWLDETITVIVNEFE